MGKKIDNQNLIRLDIDILKSLMLNLYTEKEIYEISYTNFKNKLQNTFKKYSNALEMCSVFENINKQKDYQMKINLCNDFLNKESDNGEQFKDFIDIDFDTLENKDYIGYSINNTRVDAKSCNIDLAKQELYKNKSALSIISEKIIVSFVQIFEDFFKNYLRILMLNKPDAYFYNKSIEYKRLIKKKNFDEVKEDLINETIEELMYDVNNSLSKIAKIHNFKFDKYSEIIDDFIELSLRRNVIVHNNCRVNNKYLEMLPKSLERPKLKSKLICDRNYIIKSLNVVYKLAFLLIYLIGEEEYEIDILQDTAFDLLKESEWENAMFSYDLLQKIDIIEFEEKLNFKINYLNAKKHLYGLDVVKDEIEKFDVSAFKDIFKIAKDLLLENYENVNSQLEKVYPETLNFIIIEEWPIFIDYRKTEYYKKFKQIHDDDFKLLFTKDNKTEIDISKNQDLRKKIANA